jgi:hypothetical protein
VKFIRSSFSAYYLRILCVVGLLFCVHGHGAGGRVTEPYESAKPAQTTGLAFIGTRLKKRPESERLAFEQFFSRIAFKPTVEWREEIAYVDAEQYPEFALVTPDGESIQQMIDAPGIAVADGF